MGKKLGPKVLTLDIETWPYVVKAWQMGEGYTRHDRIVKDRAIACVAAKWRGEKEVLFFSTEGQRDLRNDKKVVASIKGLVAKADVLVTQNGKRFDIPIIRGRCSVLGIGDLEKPKHYDTCQMARQLGLPSARLDYLTATYAPHVRKLNHKEFPGDTLWDECELGNKRAWKEMEAYNKQDVLGTEAVFEAIAPYFSIDFSVFHEGHERVCVCGSTEWYANGFSYNDRGKFRRFKCKRCDANFTESGAANNLLSKDKRDSLKSLKGER